MLILRWQNHLAGPIANAFCDKGRRKRTRPNFHMHVIVGEIDVRSRASHLLWAFDECFAVLVTVYRKIVFVCAIVCVAFGILLIIIFFFVFHFCKRTRAYCLWFQSNWMATRMEKKSLRVTDRNGEQKCYSMNWKPHCVHVYSIIGSTFFRLFVLIKNLYRLI